MSLTASYRIAERDDTVCGDLSLAEVHGAVRAGRLFAADHVIWEGTPRRLDALPEFSELFAELAPKPSDPDGVAGSLAHTPFPDVFVRLTHAGATGRLFLADGEVHRTIVFRAGLPISASSNVAEEQLGQVLLAHQVIDSATYGRLQQHKQGQRTDLAAAVVALQVLNGAGLTRTLAVQAMTRVMAAFGMKGTFKFVSDASAAEEQVVLQIRPRDILEAGLHRSLGEGPIRDQLVAMRDAPTQVVREALQKPWAKGISEQDKAILRPYVRPQALMAPLPALAKSLGLSEAAVGVKLFTLLRFGLLAADAGNLSALEAQLEALRGKNYFDLLDVSRGASNDEVQAAHDRALKAAGGVAEPGDPPAVSALRGQLRALFQAASAVLSDPDERLIYSDGLRLAQDYDDPAARARLTFQHFLGKGNGLTKAQHYEEASAAYQRAIQAAPGEAEVHVKLGWCRFLAGDPSAGAADASARELEQVIEKGAPPDAVYLTIGKIYKLAGDQKKAEANLRKATNLNPNNREAESELRLLFERELGGGRKKKRTTLVGSTVKLAVLALSEEEKTSFGITLAVTLGVTILLFVLANFVPGGATQLPIVPPSGDASIPPALHVLGNLEYFYLPTDWFWWARRGFLLITAIVALKLVSKDGLGDVMWSGENLNWVILAFVYGPAVGLLSPIQDVASTTGTVVGMTVFHVVAEQLFFIAFVGRALLKAIENKLVAVIVGAVLFGLYQLTFVNIFQQPAGRMALDMLQIGAFAGGAYMALLWRSGGMMAPIAAHLLVNITMMVRSGFALAG